MKRLITLVLTSAAVAAPSAPVTAQVGFGASIAVGAGEVIIGEPGHELRPGVAYVFTRADDGTWSRSQVLEAPDGTPADGFGTSVALGGDRLLVAAPEADGGAGAIYSFRRGVAGWEATGRVEADGASEGLAGIEAIAIDGDWAMVGASSQSGGRGAVLAFRREGDGWRYHSELTSAELVAGDLFGTALALSGSRLFASAPAKDQTAGAVYAFRYDAADDAWVAAGRVGAEVRAQRGALGSALTVMGDRILASGPGLLGVGAVVVFRIIEGAEEYPLSEILLPFDGTVAGFGTSLGVAGDDLWVGVANAAGGEGRAFVYRADPEAGEWIGTEKALSSDLSLGDAFGLILGASDQVMVASALGQAFGAGAAYVFENDGSTWTESAHLVGDLLGPAAITGGEVGCSEGGEAALFGCSGVDLLSFLPLTELGATRGVEINDVWGWTDPQTGQEIVIAGMYDQSVFVDVSNPTQPVYLGRLAMSDGARANVWRDMKVYRDHVFIVADGAGEHGMQVFDLTRLRGLDGSEPVTFDEDAHYDGIASAHNIVINEETGFAYAVGASEGGETCGGGLHMIDIHDPLAPTFAGCFAQAGTGRTGTGYTHDAQCVVYRGPDDRYQGRELCFAANETALSIADVTDKENPVAVGSSTYPNVGYTHQGWLTEDHRYFFTNDETDETGGQVATTRTLIWDVQELDDPILVKEYFSDNRASDHNLYVVGNTMYQSNYVSGLRVLDVSDPENPVPVGYFDTVPFGEDEPAMDGSWSNYPFFESGIVVVTSGREGLFIVRPQPRIVS